MYFLNLEFSDRMKLLFFPLFCIFPLFAHFEHDPAVFIEDRVNALTGEYVSRTCDLVIDAIQPIHLIRTYESSEGIWRICPQKELIVHGEKSGSGKIHYPLLELYEPNGSRLFFDEVDGEFRLQFPKGFANTARGSIGGRTHLGNQRVDLVDCNTIHVRTPEKTVRVYKKTYNWGRNLVFLLESEELPNGNFIVYTYDTYNRLSTIQSASPSMEPYAECSFEYHSTPKLGSDFTVTTSDGQSKTYNFKKCQSSKKAGPLFLLAQVGNEQIVYTSSTPGYRLESEGAIRVVYDQQGRVIKLNDRIFFSYEKGQTRVGDNTYSFNALGQLERINDDCFQWSKQGNLLAKNEDRYLYDSHGNVVEENGTIQKYDQDNRLITQQKGAITTTFQYLGNTGLITEVTRTTSANQIERTCFYYTSYNLLFKKTIDDGQNGIFQKSIEIKGPAHCPFSIIEKGGNTLLNIRSYFYQQNKVIETTPYGQRELPYSPSKSLLENIPFFEVGDKHHTNIPEGAKIERDFLGRITRMAFYDKDTLLQEWQWEYSTFFLEKEIDPEGVITRYEYDEAGRKTKEILKTRQGDVATHYFYNARGQMEKIRYGDIYTRIAYTQDNQIARRWEEDLEGNLVLEKAEGARRSAIPPFPEHPNALKTYDALGRLIELAAADGSVHYTIEYNRRGEPITIIDEMSKLSGKREYDERGYLIQETLLNGETLKSRLDLLGRREQLTLPDSSSIYYCWGPKFLQEITRITSKEHFEYRHHFMNYNAQGLPLVQRMSEGFGQLTFKTDSAGKITSVHSRYFEQDEIEPIEIDAKSIPFTTTTDGLGRITSFTLDHTKIAFTYDPWNRRMSKKAYQLEDGKWTITAHLPYLYDDQNEIGSIDVMENKLKELRILAEHPINTGDNAIAYEINDKPYIPLFDLEGNPALLLSMIRGKVMESYRYSPSGAEVIADYWGDSIPASKAANPWRFQGCRLDEETGLYYMKGAYFQPH